MPSESQQSAMPRLPMLDVLRGFAVLGILLVNIQSFGLVSSAYLNPKAVGEPPPLDWTVWLITHLVADEKFITILTLLFGAGILLLADRSREPAATFEAGFRRRMLWLLAIGVVHGLLFWKGDILATYALCALVAVKLRQCRTSDLVRLALILLLVPSLLALGMTGVLALLPTDQIENLQARVWLPPAEAVLYEIALYTTAGFNALGTRALDALAVQIWMLGTERFWRITALMLLGMVLYRAGFLAGRWSLRAYTTVAIAALGVGLPLVMLGVWWNARIDWEFRYSIYIGQFANYWASAPVALGWIAVLMIVLKLGLLDRAMRGLAAVGRLALSNYLFQTLACTTIFYGHGLGLYGQLTRAELLLVVVLVWAVQVALSIWWVRYHPIGPFEAAWRSLARRT